MGPPEAAASEPFVPDSPLTDPKQDRFKRLPFAERIAKTLAERRDPTSIVVLVHGRWGEGKTTLLGYIHEMLGRFDNVVPVWFNPWWFSDERSLLLSFFATIATALKKSPNMAPQHSGKSRLGLPVFPFLEQQKFYQR
jgi:predicted KAP-like P-loop ATPase